MFAVNVEDQKDYKDILPAAGRYQAEITKAKEGKTEKGRGKIDLTLKILDTIPAGEEIDEDNFENPIDGIQFATIYMIVDEDKKSTKNMFNGRLRDWLTNFNVVAEDPDGLSASDFENLVGGVTIKHQKRDKKDPNSPLQARIENSCPIDDE